MPMDDTGTTGLQMSVTEMREAGYPTVKHAREPSHEPRCAPAVTLSTRRGSPSGRPPLYQRLSTRAEAGRLSRSDRPRLRRRSPAAA
jgi:hypothetical protein